MVALRPSSSMQYGLIQPACIWSNLTIEAIEKGGIYAIDIILVSLFSTLTYITPFSSVSIVNLEHVNAGWEKVC